MKLTLLIFYVLITLGHTSCSNKTDVKEFKNWAPTPPMGWNSWDCYGSTVEEHEVKANADYMADKLKEYGWEYIVVDIRWFVENDKAGGYNQSDPRYVIDEFGRYLPAVNHFPSAKDGKGFKELAKYIHKKGLKFGIHIMRGIPKVAVENKLPIKGTNGITADQIYSTDLQCTWLRDNYTIIADRPGAQEYYNSIFELYASWGVDFIKIDDLSRPYHKGEIELIRKAIDNCGRPIVLSTSPGETPIEAADHIREHANMWRMVDDVWDTWPHIKHLMDVCQKWYPYIAPGTWPDCDMIPLGRISIRGERGGDRMTRLTKDEQYTLMTLWTIFRSPLMFGGDLPSNDKFTLRLLTNEEVLGVLNNSTNNRLLLNETDKQIWIADDANSNDKYVALFCITDQKPIDESLAIYNSNLITTTEGAQSEDIKVNVENNEYKKGIGTHAISIIEYAIPEGYDTFTAKAGLDNECIIHTEGATVKYHIFTQNPSGSAPLDSLEISLDFKELGLNGTCKVRDLWARKNIGDYSNGVSFYIRNHGAMLLIISEVK